MSAETFTPPLAPVSTEPRLTVADTLKTMAPEMGEPVYVVEKQLHRSQPFHFLTAFGNEMEARMWFLKPRKSKGRYRCRVLVAGHDVTSLLVDGDLQASAMADLG